MVEEDGEDRDNTQSADEWLLRAQGLVPAIEKAREEKGFPGRWKMIISKLDQMLSRLSDLSSHPCFSKNAVCKEQLQAISKTLNESIELADLCAKEKYQGKLGMQSDLNALWGKLDLNLRDCGLLIKTGVLSDFTLSSSSLALTNSSSSSSSSSSSKPEGIVHGSSSIRELLARLQISTWNPNTVHGSSSIRELLARRSNVGALVHLLTATSPKIREKTAAVICSLTESGSVENWLISEGVLPPLIRLVESGSSMGKEKATISLQRLSMSPETGRSIVGHGELWPLIEICRAGDSVSQAAATCALKNISVILEVRQVLAEEGIIRVMINLIDYGIFLLAYLDGPLPQESAVGALRNLVGSVPFDVLVLLGFLSSLLHVLRSESPGHSKRRRQRFA
ncbi:hypothetical protein U1Q18_036165 [Sarracenia purpurea var. burkii]